MIKSMAQAVSRMAPTALEQDLINTAARNLNEITAELEALLRICSRESGPEGNKMNKTRKRKWLVEKSDIKKLQQRMSQAKETLHFALNSSRVSNDIRRSVAVHGIYPHDTDINGLGLLEYAPHHGLYSSLEELLNIWKNILTEVGLSRRAAIAAANRLRNYELNGNETYLVQKVLNLSWDTSEVATTKVHEAILQCAGLQEALQEQPWAINTIDDTGYSPLYLATRRNQVRSMEVLISVGADVNQQSYNGLTPLMLAVILENVESVKLLLKSKYNVNLCNDEGATALDWASMKANPEVTGLLLAAGASVEHRNIYGDTPLHYLVESTNTTA
ncbi:Transient receptor potential cation channel subfamily A member 1 [Fusarium oxysporum f. sp. rapae]|uniref:Transient receptor potential cation channel subfamily A member 1 n=1 Tax=Fusarium oxysporum f. sp. rapae TaxID=485398 RepID=A0A8J5PG76_FUSOX|nr:Transient receptor potential cation channel subfamily A member 1 [Fusarium oxysporum f. sp. rapae]